MSTNTMNALGQATGELLTMTTVAIGAVLLSHFWPEFSRLLHERMLTHDFQVSGTQIRVRPRD